MLLYLIGKKFNLCVSTTRNLCLCFNRTISVLFFPRLLPFGVFPIFLEAVNAFYYDQEEALEISFLSCCFSRMIYSTPMIFIGIVMTQNPGLLYRSFSKHQCNNQKKSRFDFNSIGDDKTNRAIVKLHIISLHSSSCVIFLSSHLSTLLERYSMSKYRKSSNNLPP